MKMGSVYFIKAEGQDVFKIGYCESDLDKRINMIRIGNHLRLSFFGIINHLDILNVEKQLHMEFAANRMRGEWFAITEDQAISAIRRHMGVLTPITYTAMRYYGEPGKNGRKCNACGVDLCGRQVSSCSAACRQESHRKKFWTPKIRPDRAPKEQKVIEPRFCRNCEEEIKPRQRYCSRSCQARAYRARHRIPKVRAPKPERIKEPTPVRTCPMCRENELRPRQEYCSPACKMDAYRARKRNKEKEAATT